jgi:hypothetical protein
MVRECFEVLHDGGDMELVARAGEASQTNALEAIVGFQVRDAHLDPLPLIAGLLECWRTHERPRLVTGLFVHAARHLARGHLWATSASRGKDRNRTCSPDRGSCGRRAPCRSYAAPCRSGTGTRFLSLSNVKSPRENVTQEMPRWYPLFADIPLPTESQFIDDHEPSFNSIDPMQTSHRHHNSRADLISFQQWATSRYTRPEKIPLCALADVEIFLIFPEIMLKCLAICRSRSRG